MNGDLGGYVADGLAFVVKVTFDAGADVSTLMGSSATAFARVVGGTGLAVEGVATVSGTDEITVVFAATTLPAGLYEVQVRAIPVGHAGQTVGNYQCRMKVSLGE